MGAAFLAATEGISTQTIEQSAAYIDNWRRKLKGDKKLVIQASGAAQRAADHILGVTWDDANQPTSASSSTEHQNVPNSEAVNVSSSVHDDTEIRVKHRRMILALRVCPPPPSNMDLAHDADVEQLRHYARLMQTWYEDHAQDWLDAGILKEDPRQAWATPMHPIGSDEQLKAALQQFPRPGQHNLNSTATSEQRSAYISAVLSWWNRHVEDWADRGVIDPDKNPVVY